MKYSLRDYWDGYNYCKYIVSECGYDSALAEYDYIVDAKDYAYCKGFVQGFARYLRFYADKHADDLVMYDRETRC